MNMHREPVEPVEAWVTTDDTGAIREVVVGVWENPDAWVSAPPSDLLADPDGMDAHEVGGVR